MHSLTCLLQRHFAAQLTSFSALFQRKASDDFFPLKNCQAKKCNDICVSVYSLFEMFTIIHYLRIISMAVTEAQQS